ncbi:MAG TPA: M3 family oligoendopeptidase [Planctomycetota bacterium]|nr:M3 family oligoendopeptidase [Planctomycetota bacterium]
MARSAVAGTSRKRKDAPAFPPFPRRFAPEGLDAGSKQALDPLFMDLEERPLATPEDLVRWLEDWSELASVVAEEESRRYIDHTCHTDDPGTEKRYLEFQREIVPFVKPRWQHLKQKFAAAPHRTQIDPERYQVFNRTILNEVELFREDNVPLETRDAELVAEWQKITGAMMVYFDGKDRTLPQVSRALEETDRARREKAWRGIATRRLRDRDPIDAIYDEMVRNRDRRARIAGFANFRDYTFREKGRFDYTPDDCRRYHDAVAELVVPALRRLHERRRKKLKLKALRPWDLAVDPEGAAPLRPFAKVTELVAGARDIFARVDPNLAKLFEAIRDRGNLDLDSRKGKAPGGYQCTLDAQRVPFIFMNAAGLQRDVVTLLHEGGHAFHAILCRGDSLVLYRQAPMEFCEVASMGMEALGSAHLEVFYGKADAVRARRVWFEEILRIFPWIATIDAFQHEVYLRPDATAADRRAMWLKERRRFKGGDDWSGLEEEHASSWHAQNHPFTVPFYYIEYAIAQIGALQIWRNARKDRAKALEKYRTALALGGSRPLPELFRAAGIKFGMDAKTLKPLIQAVEAEL